MSKEKLLKSVYGLVLYCDYQNSLEIFSMIKEEWNDTQLHKRLFEACNNIFDRTEKPDLVTVIGEFRKLEWFKPSLVGELSLLTSKIPSDALIFVKRTISQIEYIEQVETASKMTSKVNDLILTDNFNPSVFAELVDEAKNDMLKGFKIDKSNSEVLLDVIEKHNQAKKGIVNGLDLGFHPLKGRVLLEDVDVMIIGARPGMGKSIVGVQLCKNLGIVQGKKVAYFALEMSSAQMMRRLAANLADVDSNKIKFGEMTEDEQQRVYSIQSLEQLENIKFFDTSKDIRQMRMDLSEMKMQGGLDVVIIDYLQKIDAKGGNNLHEKVSKISDGVKRIAQNLKVPVIAFAQLSRAVETRGGDKRPILSDLKESGDIEQDASIVGFLWRPAYYGFNTDDEGNDLSNVCELIIAKNREGERGTFELTIDLATSKIF